MRNAKYLNQLLESIGVPTQDIYFSTNRSEGITSFRGGIWKGLELSGTFHYPTQFFLELRVGDWEKKRFHARFLPGFLAQIEDGTAQKKTEDEEPEVFVSQTTPQAILERKLLQELLSLHSIKAVREDIVILDSTMSRFFVSEAFLQNMYKISFLYNSDEKILEDVTFQSREEMTVFDTESFSLETASTIIGNRIHEILRK